MLNRVNHITIAKDLTRTVSLDIEGAGFNLKEGEIFLADKNFKLFSAEDGSITYATTNTIYIGEGTAEALNYSTPDGVAVTGVKRIMWSPAINGALVKAYNGTAYSAITPQISTLANAFTSVIGETYAIKIVSTHLREDPRQYSHTYEVVATSTASDDVYGALVKKINGHDQALVTAAFATNTLTLTAKDPNSTDTLDSIDDLSQITFEIVQLSDSLDGLGLVTATTQAPSLGNGDWRMVRDAEKAAQHDQRGAWVNTTFPIQTPEFRTVKAETYDTIVIEYEVGFRAPTNDTRYEPKTVVIYSPAGAAQGTTVVTALNGWMASTPGGFANITI